MKALPLSAVSISAWAMVLCAGLSACTSTPSPSLVRHSGTGVAVTVPMLYEQGVPVVQGRVNGQQNLWMIADTGSQRSLLEADAARRSGVATTGQAAQIIGTRGSESVLHGRAARLEIGAWQSNSVSWLVRTRKTHHAARRYDLNLIGADVLVQECDWITFDFRQKTVTLGGAGALPRTGGMAIPLKMQNGLPHVQLRTGGQAWWALVDTGASAALELDEATAASLCLQSSVTQERGTLAGVGSGNATEVSRVRLPMISLQNLDLTNVNALVVPRLPKVGTGLLRNFRVTFDWRHSLLWLE